MCGNNAQKPQKTEMKYFYFHEKQIESFGKNPTEEVFLILTETLFNGF